MVVSGEGECWLCSLWENWSVGLHLNMNCARACPLIGTRLVFGDSNPPAQSKYELHVPLHYCDNHLQLMEMSLELRGVSSCMQ